MKFIQIVFLAAVLFLGSPFGFGQNPGNIGTVNLTGWFKPDALPLGNVASWTTTLSSLGSITVTDVGAPFPQATNTPAGNISNYNTTLFFNNNTSTNLQALANTSALNLMTNNTGTGTFFCAYYLPAATTNGHMMLWNNSPNAIQFRNLGASGRIAIGLAASNSSNASRDWIENLTPSIVSIRGNRSTATSLNAFENDLIFTTSPASQSSGATGLYFGHFPGNATSTYNGYIHEYIFYNTNLTAAQMRRVHSYLAIKYGITLDITGGGVQGNYTSTTDQVLWSASLQPSYHNNVIGIGRDDSQALVQKQSHAFDDNYRLYLGTLAATNVANTSSFLNNISYVLMGQNTDGGCATTTSNLEAPVGINNRMAKEWKVTKTNFSQAFNWDLKVDTCQLAGTSVGPVTASNFRLLVDDDGNFGNATVYSSGAGLNMTYLNGQVTVTGISNTIIPDNSTRYLTIAYNAPTYSLSGNTAICVGDSALLTLSINVPGTFNVSYSNGTTVTNLTNVSNGYTFYVNPTTTTTYAIANQANFLNCCGGATATSATITVNPLPIVTANATATTICAGASTTLTGGGASTYVWNNGATNGVPISPAAATTYTVTGTSAAGCVNTANVTINVTNNPVVGATANVTTVCVGNPVILNGTGATTYVWNNGGVNNGNSFPTTTTTYTVTGTASGCSATASILITVNPLPIVTASATNNPICYYDSTAVYGGGAVSYTWSNGVFDNVYFFPTATTTYTVTGTDANNCQNTNTISVTVNALPNVTANASALVLCDGASTVLSGSGANTYAWDNGVTNGASFIPVATTLYTVIGTDLNGCKDTNNVTVTVNPNPVVSITASVTTLCIGEPVTLSGNGANTYSWNNGVTDNVAFNPTTTATYTVVGTNGFGCTDTTAIQVTVNNLPPVTANASVLSVCEGEPLTLNGGGALYYTWDNSVMNGVSLVPATSAMYTVTGTDVNGCENTDSVYVVFFPAVPFSLGPDTVVCPREPITLTANGNFSSYLWSTGSMAPSIVINFANSYWLTVTDVNGCPYTDDLEATLAEDCFVTLFIPNAFTPNNDEHNRYFRTTGSYIKFFHMEIYNRWGEMVFETDDIDSHWDGTYGGKICPQGMYTYIVKYAHDLNSDEKLTQTGHLNLMR